MRIFLQLFALLFTVQAMAVAPYGIKGQNQSTIYSNVHQFPNNQVTNLGGIDALVETGNKNILVNPSFEHSTFSTGWTNSAGTFTAETSVLVDGKKSAKLVLAAQTMSLTQSSTLYQAQFADGVQGLASVRIKSDVALSVCVVQAGVVSTSLCLSVPAYNTWGQYKIPFILGATSSGISIASSGAVTGTVYIDDAFVGPQNLLTEVPTCDGSATCETEFSASISAAAAVSNENISTFLTTCSYAAGDTTCLFGSGIFTVAPNCVAIIEASSGSVANISSTSSSQVVVRTKAGGVDTQLAFKLVCQKQGVDYAAAKATSPGFLSRTTDVDILSAKVSTADAVSDENVDFITGNCTDATLGEATCLFNAGTFTVTPNCTCQIVGTGSTTTKECLIDTISNTQAFIFTRSNGAKADLAFNLSCQKTGEDSQAIRNIVGSFKEVMTVPGATKSIDFGFRSSASCTTGNCPGTFFGSTLSSGNITFSATGTYNVSIPAGKCSTTPFCITNLNPFNSHSYKCHMQSSSSTAGIVYCTNSSGTLTNDGFQFNCSCEAP
jgi:hypothetical protein